ncbi:hypothetical protein GCM10018793_47690 [Streptomyces sulfonofaciens]|uniref:Uncharacterized protein n=1 Tax=Streptomyces sulfonofaciens TaxID=68272 RepID=A0A919GGU5_9ACTN|nr:hypothetical protein [Streptomyces sulfonofaciens]GHH84126.1 hypothetical protein GCM10018793_47690 [Streptomyces sulfonofaciens]
MTVHDVARLLPATDVLRDHCRALAMLEAVLNPDRADRAHAFDAHWSATEEMASMTNGSGDEYAVVFSPAGAYVRGFAHESVMSPYAGLAGDGPWPGVLDEVPDAFRAYVTEPAFTDEDGTPVVTACLWRAPGDDAWRTGTIDFPDDGSGDPDGSGSLFHLLTDRSPEAFRRFAEDYYEVPVALSAVRHVYAGHPLTEEVVGVLNPGLTLVDLTEDAVEIGYPLPRRDGVARG